MIPVILKSLRVLGAQMCALYGRWMPFWAVIAVINMTLALALTMDPQRAADFETVWRWTGRWLIGGEDLYASRLSGTDYPPHAILILSPIALLPLGVAIRLWTALNLLLALAAPYLAARVVKPEARTADIAGLTILFLGWSGSKTLLQFTLLTLVFGLAAMLLAERRPRWSGICLGVALMKPQIGLPFLLWVLFTRRWKVTVAATLFVGIASLLWCFRAGADPLDVALRYTQILELYYVKSGGLIGVTQLGPLIGRLAPASLASVITGLLSAALLAVICVEAYRSREATLLYLVPAMAAVWALLTFYHLSYGLVLLLPVAALLLLTQDPSSMRARHALFWTMQIFLVADFPGLWRRLGPTETGSQLPLDLIQDSYRFLLLGAFFGLWTIHRRINASRPQTSDTYVT